MELESRYSVVTEKHPAEVVLLQGRGCAWKKCSFCDYHMDKGSDAESVQINKLVLAQVTGKYGHLESLNSGSLNELPLETREDIKKLCQEKNIKHLHFEVHWLFRHHLAKIAEFFGPEITLHPRIGVETFDETYREEVLVKGMGYGLTPQIIREQYEEMCLLFGIVGQSKEQFIEDLRLATKYFDRVYVNLFNNNSKDLKADPELIKWFMDTMYAELEANHDVFVLVNNTDLGVGE